MNLGVDFPSRLQGQTHQRQRVAEAAAAAALRLALEEALRKGSAKRLFNTPMRV